MSTNNTPQGITPEVGKRYVTRGGWVTPPLEAHTSNKYPFWARITYTAHASWTHKGNNIHSGEPCMLDLIAEYVEPTVTDTFRRDLIARLYVELVGSVDYDHIGFRGTAEMAIKAADILIEAMEGEV